MTKVKNAADAARLAQPETDIAKTSSRRKDIPAAIDAAGLAIGVLVVSIGATDQALATALPSGYTLVSAEIGVVSFR